jgi:hypothetical protein
MAYKESDRLQRLDRKGGSIMPWEEMIQAAAVAVQVIEYLGRKIEGVGE